MTSEARQPDAMRCGASGTPEFAVVIPARNESELLPRCLEALDGLDYPRERLEIVVVDNGSEDDTNAVAQRHGVRVVTLEHATTIAAARNEGVRATSASYVAFLDADCCASADWLTAAAAVLEQTELQPIIACGSYPAPPASGTWMQRTWGFLAARPPGPPAPTAWLPSANLIVRRDAFLSVGGFNEQLESCEDADLCYRLQKLGTIVYASDVRAVHLREPRTIGAFFRKEIWHGKNSYDGLKGGRVSIAELPSLLLPLASTTGYVTAAVGAVLLAAQRGPTLLAAGLLIACLPPAALTLRSFVKKRRPLRIPEHFIVYTIYCAARAAAFSAWITRTGIRSRQPKKSREDHETLSHS